MDSRAKLRLNKIFSNLNQKEEKYHIYNCDVNQFDGSLILEKEVHVSSKDEVRILSQEILRSPRIRATCEDYVPLPPAIPQNLGQTNLLEYNSTSLSTSPSQDPCSHQIITFEADFHRSFNDTCLKPDVESISKTAEMRGNDFVVKSVSFIKPKYVKLHSNKQISIANDSLNTIKDCTSKPMKCLSKTVLKNKETPVKTRTQLPNLSEKELDAHSSSIILKPIENTGFPDITEDEIDSNRSSPSILVASSISIDGDNIDGSTIDLSTQSTIKRAITIQSFEEADEPENLNDIPKRKRSKKSDKKNWKKNNVKILRENGMQYNGKKKEGDVWVYDKIKEVRTLKPRCNCKLSSQESKFKCLNITDENRNVIFKNFWKNMSWKEKKMYVKILTIVKPIERKRSEKEDSRRKQTLELYLEVNSIKLRVCKTMFLNTLAIGEWMLHNWTKQDTNNTTEEDKTNTQTETRQKVKESKKEEQVKQFFKTLPKLESHYCRSQSSKLYLEPLWESKTQLLREYNDVFAKENGYDPVSITTLSSVFQVINLALYRPKKDLCDICEAYKCKNIPEENYIKHIKMKDAARTEKEIDKKSNKEVLTMDLQSVLLCPKSNASALYYKTKLIVHNFTVYDIKRSEGYCFIWNETEGSLSANDFSSVIIRMLDLFIIKHNLTEGSEIVIYSDGCTYQNRNVTLSNALLNFVIHTKITIVQKILEKGHTQMEADSMHSVLERQIRNKKINVPADYVNIAKTACVKKPYYVEYLEHSFFRNFDTLRTYKTIRPGRKTGDPVVTDLRQLKYLPKGQILYRLGFTEEYHEYPLPGRMKFTHPVRMQNLPQLYSERLKIKKSKFEHLQQLKMVMEVDYHPFYDAIPYE